MDQNHILTIENLKISYGVKPILKGINLEVTEGQVIGYIGPNGAGKSTTIKILLGLEEGYSGKIEIFGQDISTDNVEYRRKIGYVPERAEIYDHCALSTIRGVRFSFCTRKMGPMRETTIFNFGRNFIISETEISV